MNIDPWIIDAIVNEIESISKEIRRAELKYTNTLPQVTPKSRRKIL